MKRFFNIFIFTLAALISMPCAFSIIDGAPVAAAQSKKKAKAKSKNKKKSKKKKSNNAKRSQTTVSRELQQTNQEITTTRQAIDKNKRRTRQNLDRLNNLDAQITRQQTTINSLNVRLDTINEAISRAEDSIHSIEVDIAVLRGELKNNLRDLRSRRRRINSLAFIFSAADFNSATHRYEYIQQTRNARDRRINQLHLLQTQLTTRRTALTKLRDLHNSTLNQLSVAQQVMEVQQGQARDLARQLRSESSNLQQILAEKQRRARQLDAELNRVIDANLRGTQTRKPQNSSGQTPNNPSTRSGTAQADRKLSGSFLSNKGRLLFPVSGKYTITSTFGRPTHQGIAIKNNGIHISVAPGTKARAVFDGVVISSLILQGVHNVVTIRHGDYITTYAGLANTNVSKGQKVKTGQNIGTIYTNSNDDNRTELYFEIRHKREKLNPLLWVK